MCKKIAIVFKIFYIHIHPYRNFYIHIDIHSKKVVAAILLLDILMFTDAGWSRKGVKNLIKRKEN